MATRLVVREMGCAPGDFFHDEIVTEPSYEAAVLMMDGLRMAGFMVIDHFGSAGLGYEDWRMENLTSEEPEFILVSLTREG